MDILLPSAVIVILTVSLSVAVAMLLTFVRNQSRVTSSLGKALQDERRERESLAYDLHALIACSKELGEEIRGYDGRQRSLAGKLNALAQQVDGAQAVDQAERLMANGLGVEQITRMCALSRGEAALLERFKQRNQAA